MLRFLLFAARMANNCVNVWVMLFLLIPEGTLFHESSDYKPGPAAHSAHHTLANTHSSISDGDVPAFPPAAFVLVICHMSPSHQMHRNIWSCEQTGRITPWKLPALIAQNPVYLKSLSLSPLHYCWSLMGTWQLGKQPQFGPDLSLAGRIAATPPRGKMWR